MLDTATDLPPPPPDCALKEDASTEQNATEVTIPVSPDVPETYGAQFEHKDNRAGFIQKVLVIKLMQAFAMTTVLTIYVELPHPIFWTMRRDREMRTKAILITSLILVGVQISIHYCDKARFARPYNYMFLLTYPLSIAFFASFVVSDWTLTELFMSWVYFNLVVFALLVYSIFALQSKIEFKTNIGLLIAAGTLISAYAISVSVPFTYRIDAFSVFYWTLAMFALTAYTLYDLQIMMSKTYRIRLSPSDFVKAAVIMHIDYRYMIMNMFNKKAGTSESHDIDTASLAE